MGRCNPCSGRGYQRSYVSGAMAKIICVVCGGSGQSSPSVPSALSYPVSSHEALDLMEETGSRARHCDAVYWLIKRFPVSTPKELVKKASDIHARQEGPHWRLLGGLDLQAIRRRITELKQDHKISSPGYRRIPGAKVREATLQVCS